MYFFNLLGSLLETTGMIFAGFALVGVQFDKKGFQLLLVGIAGGIWVALMTQLFPPALVLLLSILFLIILSLPLVRLSIKHTVLGIITGLGLVFISEMVTIYPIIYFLQPESLTFNGRPDLLFLLALPHIILIFSTAAFAFKKGITAYPKKWLRYNAVDQSIKRFEISHYVIVLVILSILTIGLFFLTFKTVEISQLTNSKFLVTFALLLSVILFYLVRMFFGYGIEKMEYHLEKEHRNELESYVQIIKSQRHDFNFHLNAIYGMLENRKHEECRNYIKEINTEAGIINDVLPLHHSAISALLLNFKRRAMNENVDLNLSVKASLKEMPCSVYEMNKILGNLLQNALDHVASHSDKWIEVSIVKKHPGFMISVNNPVPPSEETITRMFEDGFTTKGRLNHYGTGLSTVKRIIQKYDGAIYPQIQNEAIQMIILLPIEERRE